MGTDISGRVECRTGGGAWEYPDDEWDCAISLDLLFLARDHASFGCLFGVREVYDFEPLFPDRGMPEDAATPTRAAVDAWRSASWFTWAELRSVDWDVRSEDEDALTRREVVLEKDAWLPVWAVMRTLAGLYGDDNVRLVAWFDG
ncbi:hypothetical protein ABZZ79_33165 [Streptomyces sp. NPDC006458]|uniref:hypothetical protein n=1 Tax=Streptomyces sp. NPDC006458 TaxID=3154302 RepID=UPI0033BDA087